MTIKDRFEERLVRMFINPHLRNEPLDFKTRLKEAKQILISYPAGMEYDAHRSKLDVFDKIFPRQKITILHFDLKKYSPQNTYIHHHLYPYLTLPDIPRQNLRQFAKSKSLSRLRQQRFDIFFDLDPNFNLLNVYLCRQLRPFIRVGFKKPYSSCYYNVEYNVGTSVSYSSKLEGLISLLQSMLS